MGLLNPHLEDDDFADVWSARSAAGIAESDRPAENHLRKCGECRVRYASFASWLDGVRVDAHAEADEVFNRERLATQQMQISLRGRLSVAREAIKTARTTARRCVRAALVVVRRIPRR